MGLLPLFCKYFRCSSSLKKLVSNSFTSRHHDFYMRSPADRVIFFTWKNKIRTTSQQIPIKLLTSVFTGIYMTYMSFIP